MKWQKRTSLFVSISRTYYDMLNLLLGNTLLHMLDPEQIFNTRTIRTDGTPQLRFLVREYLRGLWVDSRPARHCS